jgi:hypothetical protein
VPVRDQFDADQNVLLVTIDGHVQDEDLLKYARIAAGNAAMPPDHDVLVDMRGTESLGDVQAQTLRQVANLFTRTDAAPEQSRVALVAPHDVGYGLSRMYQAFRSDSPIEVRVFREMREARAWLGLPLE